MTRLAIHRSNNVPLAIAQPLRGISKTSHAWSAFEQLLANLAKQLRRSAAENLVNQLGIDAEMRRPLFILGWGMAVKKQGNRVYDWAMLVAVLPRRKYVSHPSM